MAKLTEAQRKMTAGEAKWWGEFRAVLRRMPKGIELNARAGGQIGIAPTGSREANFNGRGDADNFDADEWDDVTVPRLDGRDSHL